MLDLEGALDLLKAVSLQWAKDARADPHELPGLAAWLDVTPDELHLRLDGRPVQHLKGPGRTCPGCGAPLPDHNASGTGQGRKRLYCGDRCKTMALKARAT